MWIRKYDRRLFVALLLALVVLAWTALWLWGRSPYARFLSHQDLDEVTTSGPVLLLVFVAGWTLMTFAMMLPTSVPLISMFHSLTRRRPDHRLLVSLLMAGYLGVWMLVGFLMHLGDLVIIHHAVEQSAWLEANTWVIGAATLATAGLYQFTPLKYQCLDKCRSPFSFVIEHWQGRRERVQAIWLGIHHGMFCVGCCWALMLLMFGVGVGNLAWMLALGTVMAVEKNMPWGRRLSIPLGICLLASALLVAYRGLSA